MISFIMHMFTVVFWYVTIGLGVTLYFDKFDRDWLDKVIREAYEGRFDGYDDLPGVYLLGVYIGTTAVWPAAIFTRITGRFDKGGKKWLNIW